MGQNGETMRPLGAQISHMLKSRGVDVIFGIPGVHNVEMYRGIEEAGITHVLARHEQGAGFMADGYARASGKPGVAYVITGPGLCNIMTPLGQAYSDSVSVLTISSCLDEHVGHRGQLHQMKDQRAAAATVCDWSEEARSPRAAYDLIDRAFVEFETKRPRPKHIQVPIGLLGAMAPEAPSAKPGALEEHSGHSAGDMRGIALDLLNAKKPLFILGGGLAASGDAAALHMREFLKECGAAAFMTYAGSGLLAPDEPMSFGTYLGRSESKRIIGESDLVIAVGTELSECDLWRDELGHTGRLVRVDIDPEVLADRHRADTTVLADAFSFVMKMRSAFSHHLSVQGREPDDAVVPKWDASEIAGAKTRFRAESDAERPGIAAICDALRDVMPDDAMVYSDMTQFAYVAKEVWDLTHPHNWHHPTGFGTLGYALPASIGGAMARRGKPTVCIAGDYGFQYTVQELGAAVEMKLPIPILLWDNHKLKEIEDSMVESQIAPNAVVALNPDFCKLAESYGCLATEPATLEELQAALMQAFNADRPTMIRMTAALS
ncbi:acetolactate synthase-1/2/3 large subunit/5-guanidino-2-oxopentanoate decarboxylase [Shimia isoporae]|uniref:Acetolactate synthase-1/2/3 large subunit/5-guanidino-2-oxopentanoate decarboxylase n=1 Tax=Shimia isoporae TaxID=647720 RepID=A0A4V2Q3V1_9RHOB|nr:5-guanidino-2-oxopentanoate decarboxylase [Shimia isoporae]TCL08620.1 acetolactate synthase-1/2/3 large subunit/5-guanidino-2-oxopentanoate decarboxylase [Shimia isoporae]